MKNKALTEISNEELLKNEKKMKALTAVFAGVLIILFATTILVTLKRGFSALVVTPIALLLLFSVTFNSWNELKKEIKSRNL
jgi:hypothetical protein